MPRSIHPLPPPVHPQATYVRVVGLEQSRAIAQRLIAEAKADLAPYGAKAVPLLALADFITARTN